MLTISALKSVRVARNYPRNLLSVIASIQPTRLKELELKEAEPWFDEALSIARALSISVHDLFVSGDLTTFDYDPRFFAVDLKFWTEGVRLPLSVALRLQHRFGLPAVDDLDPSPLTRQLWSVLEASERHPEASGWCPWCQADIVGGQKHADHCLPHNLLGARDLRGRVAIGTADAPLPGRKGGRKGSAKVPGLKRVRELAGLRQAEMAQQLGFAVNHYARVERCELPLVLPKADLVCQLFNVSRDVLFGGCEAAPSSDGSHDQEPELAGHSS